MAADALNLYENFKFSWPLNNVEVRGTNPQCSQKSARNIRLPLNVIANNLLLTGSLTYNINGWLTYILYMYFILYSYNEVS